MQIFTLHADGIFDHTDFVTHLIKNLRESTFEEVLSVFEYEETFTIGTLLSDLISKMPEIKMEKDARECMIVQLINDKLQAYKPICQKCQIKMKSNGIEKKSDENKVKKEEEHSKDYDSDSTIIPDVTIEENDDEAHLITELKNHEGGDSEEIEID